MKFNAVEFGAQPLQTQVARITEVTLMITGSWGIICRADDP